MIKEIILKDRRIEYELQIKAVKNINLRIKADRTVFVSASPSVSETHLKNTRTASFQMLNISPE